MIARIPALITFLATMAAASTAMTSLAKAEDIYITPGLGTLGLSVKGTYRGSSNMGASAVVSGYGYSSSKTFQGVPASVKTSAFDVGVMMDYYPLGGNLHVTGGIRYSKDKVTGTVADGGSSVGYTVEPNKIQPYIGAGYSLELTDRAALDVDLGTYYTGTPTLKVTSGTGNAQTDAAIAKARSEAESHTFYPVAQLGLRYRF
jgi:hypothetical protein